MKKRIILSILLILSISSFLIGCEEVDNFMGILKSTDTPMESDINEELDEFRIDPDSSYNTLDEVSLYIHEYKKLPNNFITKKEASELGWESNKGNLWDVTDEKSIGGDRFGNREGLLPKSEGRQYYECDINYEGGYRGPERIVYSNDGLIYYTEDHYKTFTLIYGDE